MPPIPSTPASIPTPRKMTSTGIPIRVENELTRMLAATNTAPRKRRLLIALALITYRWLEVNKWNCNGCFVQVADKSFVSSNTAIAQAIATFIEELWPCMGMWTVSATSPSKHWLTPRRPQPTTNPLAVLEGTQVKHGPTPPRLIANAKGK